MKDFLTQETLRVRAAIDRMVHLALDGEALAEWIKPLAVVLAVTLMAFLAVDVFYKILVWQALRAPAAAAGSPVRAAAGSLREPAERYAVIAERNLFATTLKAIPDKSTAGSLPSEEYTDFELKGTVAVDARTGYAIVEEKGKGKQKLYRIGEMIGSARLVRVTRNTAVLQSGGRELVMKVKEAADGLAPGRSAVPSGGRSIAVSREEVTQSLGDLKSIMSQAVVRPYMMDGAQQGFVISNIVPGSLYSRLGLQNGDVIVEVNNSRLEGADDVLQLVEVMQSGGSVTVGLTRNGQNQTLNYSFQ